MPILLGEKAWDKGVNLPSECPIKQKDLPSVLHLNIEHMVQAFWEMEGNFRWRQIIIRLQSRLFYPWLQQLNLSAKFYWFC